jgi:AsmA protein
VAGNTFHSFSSIECRWPPPESSEPSLLILTGDVPDLRRLESASAALAIPALPADTFFSWLSVATPHPPAVLEGAGTLSANLAWRPAADASTLQQPASSSKQVAAAANPGLTGQLEFSGASLNTDPDNNRSLALGDVVLRSTAAPAILPPRSHRLRRSRGAIAAMQTSPVGNSFDLAPVSLALGGKQPATLEGHFDANGYTLHLAGSVTRADLLGLGNAVPQIGDGLEAFLNQIADDNGGGDAEPTSADTEASREVPATLPATPIHIDLTAARTWGGPQVWRQNTPAASTHSKRR